MVTHTAATDTEKSSELWPVFYWLLGSIWAPITLPWIVYQMLGSLHQKYKRTTLPGKVVLITGASSGLGEALAHAFYSAGCKIILAARRKEELERVKRSLLATHHTIPTHVPVILPLDLSDLNAMKDHVATVLNIFNQIDILINNGGISSRGNVESTDVEVYQQIMLVNYFGQLALTKAVLPSMIARGSGHIVAVSSVQGRIGLPQRSAYGASKHAVQAFCDSLRAELAPHIDVTVASPGYIQTHLSLNALTETGSAYGQMDETTANGYTPEYVAEQILRAVVERKSEIVIAPLSARVAMILRTFMPSIYFWIMEKRAKKAV